MARNEAQEAIEDNGVLDLPVRPLGVPIRKPAPARKTKVVRAVLWGDTHFPSHDQSALDVVAAIVKEEQPDILCHMGDLLDCYHLSRYDKDPHRKETLQDEIDMARVHLAQMRLLAPNARFILLEGNHEERLTRTLWNMDGSANALGKLTAFRKTLTWPNLLGLDELHIEFVPYKDQSQFSFLPKFILKHGNLVRQTSAYTAHGEWRKYGKSGASGHTHRLAQFYHRDHNGNHIWLETGCTCSLSPEYSPDPDWQQGCVVLTFDVETGAFQAESIYIHRGTAMWRGKMYGKRTK